jgi:hypothetical protein
MALTRIQPGMLADSSVKINNFSASGTAGNTTYLRGDNTWAQVSDQQLFTTSSVVFANLDFRKTTDPQG